MELFNIGPVELLFLLALAVIILGPQRAAEVAGQLGRFFASLRRNVNAVRSELSQSLEEETKALREVQEGLQKTGAELQESLQRLEQEPTQQPPPSSSSALGSAETNGTGHVPTPHTASPQAPEEKRP